MLTKENWEKKGWTIVPKGGWMAIDPELLGGDWDVMAKALGFDPKCKEVIIGITAFKQINY